MVATFFEIGVSKNTGFYTLKIGNSHKMSAGRKFRESQQRQGFEDILGEAGEWERTSD